MRMRAEDLALKISGIRTHLDAGLGFASTYVFKPAFYASVILIATGVQIPQLWMTVPVYVVATVGYAWWHRKYQMAADIEYANRKNAWMKRLIALQKKKEKQNA